MTITVESLLPWISFLAAIGALIMVFAKMKAQVERNHEKDKEQDEVIANCVSKEALARVEKRTDDVIVEYERKYDILAVRVTEHGETLASFKATIIKYEQKYDDLVVKVNAHGETLASLTTTLDQLRQSVDRLTAKIDGLKSLT